MIKQVKYALMALVLLGGMKIFQTLFINQDHRKKDKHSVKKEVVEPAKKDAKADVISLIPNTPILLEDSLKSEIPEEKGAVSKKAKAPSESVSSNSASYPTLADLKKNYLSIKNASLQEGRSREDVVIRYYKHEKDGNKVYSLKKLRYYLHEKPATETEGLGSNVIYYGNQVKPEDIQIVAYTLLESGIPLKSIERSKFDWKSNAIEIGTDSLLIGKTNLSKEQIRDFSF